MTISKEVCSSLAPDVLPKALANVGFINPFITLSELEELCNGNETLMYCFEGMILSSLRYAETVCRFEQIVRRGQTSNEDDTRKEIETLRSAVHDSTIASIDLLSRNLKKHQKNNDWIGKMAGNRAAYGKFAILIAFEVVLQQGGAHA